MQLHEPPQDGGIPVPRRFVFRKYPRTKVSLPAEYTTDGMMKRTRVLTLGGGGLFVGILDSVALGSALEVRFRPAKHFPVIPIKARVCYQLPGQGVGIEFTEIGHEHRRMILRLILSRLEAKRRYRRARYATQVEHARGIIIGFSRDISVGGMFVETEAPPPPGTELNLRFNLDDDGPIVIATAEVRYAVEKIGMGVEFTDISSADRSRIDVCVTRGESSREAITH